MHTAGQHVFDRCVPGQQRMLQPYMQLEIASAPGGVCTGSLPCQLRVYAPYNVSVCKADTPLCDGVTGGVQFC